jgi:hypothetical protein
VRCASAGVQTVTTDGYLVSLRLTDDRRLTPEAAKQLRSALPASTRIWLALMDHDRVIVSLRKADPDEGLLRLEETLDALASLPLAEEARRHRRRLDLVDGRAPRGRTGSPARSRRPTDG